MKGTLVHVLRSALGESTNGGASSIHKSFILCGEGVPEKSAPNPSFPGLRLVKRMIGGRPADYAEPMEQPEGKLGPMFGGNYVVLEKRAPGGGFLGGHVEQVFIPVHDRFETQAEYDILSR